MSERVLCQVHEQGLLNNPSMLPLPELPEGGKGLGVVTVSGVCLLNSKFFEDLRTINRELLSMVNGPVIYGCHREPGRSQVFPFATLSTGRSFEHIALMSYFLGQHFRDISQSFVMLSHMARSFGIFVFCFFYQELLIFKS